MSVPANHPHRHTVQRRPFNAPGTENTSGIAIEQQGQQHPWRILRAARTAVVDMNLAQVHLLDGLENEMGHVSGGYPVAQIGRQEQWGVVINVDKSRSHILTDSPAPPLVQIISNNLRQSPTGC